MPWNDLASNQMVSFTDAQTGGFSLQPGQSNVTSNQCMTKNDALTKYVLDSSAMASYANNQLVPKSVWISGTTGVITATMTNNSPTGLPNVYLGEMGILYLGTVTQRNTNVFNLPLGDSFGVSLYTYNNALLNMSLTITSNIRGVLFQQSATLVQSLNSGFFSAQTGENFTVVGSIVQPR